MSNEAKESEASAVKPEVREATREDFIALAKKLRSEDLQEIRHSSGLQDPELILLLCHKLSTESFAIVREDNLIALFGVTGIPGTIGFPWMLASDDLRSIRKTFLREAGAWVQAMLKVYQKLENYAWSENKLHIQWLKWLGFTIEDPVPFGADDKPFHHFYLKAPDV